MAARALGWTIHRDRDTAGAMLLRPGAIAREEIEAVSVRLRNGCVIRAPDNWKAIMRPARRCD